MPPTAAWTAQQMIDAFPDDTAPRWLLRDRDAVYGDAFRRRVAGMGIGEVISSLSSPWQNPYAERLIGSIRRECLDHVIILGERHLRRTLTAYLTYYHGSCTHLSPFTKTRPPHDRYWRSPKATWSPSRKSADYTIATNDAPPDVCGRPDALGENVSAHW
jgi:putative transposase